MPIHVRAEPGDYAEAVLLPGDPLRARYIAETFLIDARNIKRAIVDTECKVPTKATEHEAEVVVE